MKEHRKEAMLWILASSLFMLSHLMMFPNIFTSYRVSHVETFKIHIRNGLNTYEVKGKHDYMLDDKVKVKNLVTYESRSQYQKSRRIYGYTNFDEITLSKRSFSLRRLFYQNLPHELKDFFDQTIDTIFSVLSLQLMGLLEILKYILRKFLTNKQYKYVEISTIILYAYLFGLSFGVVRIFLKSIYRKKEKVLPILLILYPHSFYDTSFNLIYLPMLLQNLSTLFVNVDYKILRTYFLLRLFGKLQILELIFYPVIKIYSGLILFSTLLFNHKLASALLKYGMAILNQKRLLVMGAPSIVWLGFYLFSNKKNQIIIMMLMLVVMCYYPFTRVVMINVYQGDATLITLPFNAISILIDTGKASSYNTLKRTLHLNGIKKLDYLVITHEDLDHSENKEALIQDFDVSFLIESKEETIPFMTQLLKDKKYDDVNEESLILYFNTSLASFLFMGDAGIPQEKDIIKDYPKLRVDVLKVGHHGSNTSSSSAFLEHLRPKIALISSDPRIYGHPHPEVMKRLQSFRIPALQTSIEKDVTFKLLPFFNIVLSKEGGFGIMK